MVDPKESEQLAQIKALSDPELASVWAELKQVQLAQTVRRAGYTWEGMEAFAKLMLFDPRKGLILEPALHHQQWMQTCLEYNRVCILAPPESAKTTYMMLMLGFTVGHFPATQSMVISVSDAQAEDMVGAVAAWIEHHPGWKMCFPEVIPDRRRGWGYEKGFFVMRDGDYGGWLRERGARKDPTFVGVGYQNRAIIGKRVDGVMIVDDMMDEKNTASLAELDTAKSIFVKVISSRPTETGKLILVGTPWKEDDVYATAVATGLYKNYITPAWTESKGKRTSYWSEVWPMRRLDNTRVEFGERDFQLMFLMNLSASKGQVLPESSLHPFYIHSQIQDTWPEYWGIDVAITASDLGFRRRISYAQVAGRSFFALAKLKAAPFGLVVFEIVRAQVSLGEAIELVKSHLTLSRPRKIHVENWGVGEMVLQQLIREIGAPVFPYKDTKDKTARFSSMERHFASNRIMLSDRPSPGLKTLYDEWVGFPSYPTTDTLDAVAAAVDAAGFSIYAGGKYSDAKRDIEAITNQALMDRNRLAVPKSRFSEV